METQMTPPLAHRITQLALFGERPAVPSWNDLNESMRNDAVKLLAHSS
jgi:hypothetical protein